MGCGCGGSSSADTSGNASGVLLSGTLDGQYAGLPGGTAGPATTDINGAATVNASLVSSGGFWIVVLFLLGGAWFLDRMKKEHD